MTYRKGRFRNLLRRFARERKGSTAIEFAAIIVPFLMMIFGTLEIALIHLTRTSISNAMEIESRPIMTGEAGCISLDAFKTGMCSNMGIAGAGGCMPNMKMSLEELSSFAANPAPDPSDFGAVNENMDHGQGGSVMLLRTYHRWDVLFPFLDKALGGDDGEVMLVSHLAFRNEPFAPPLGC